jgi:hypothetical protein
MEGLDLKGLPEEQVRWIREFVEYLKQKAKSQQQAGLVRERTRGRKMIRSWPLGVKGSLTRNEIYEDL